MWETSLLELYCSVEGFHVPEHVLLRQQIYQVMNLLVKHTTNYAWYFPRFLVFMKCSADFRPLWIARHCYEVVGFRSFCHYRHRIQKVLVHVSRTANKRGRKYNYSANFDVSLPSTPRQVVMKTREQLDSEVFLIIPTPL